MSGSIKYKSGYKYQLFADYKAMTGIVGYLLSTGYIALDLDGVLYIRAGYAWDGPSGPAIDTVSAMRGSLVHDALFQLLRGGYLPQSDRKAADIIYRRLCVEDGMSVIRAWAHFTVLRLFGDNAAARGSDNPVLSAP